MRFLSDDGKVFDTLNECKMYEKENIESKKSEKRQAEEEIDCAYEHYLECKENADIAYEAYVTLDAAYYDKYEESYIPKSYSEEDLIKEFLNIIGA